MPNVLVIDDTADVRAVVSSTLAHFGFATREAADGAAGIELALAEPPDLILCDVRMPGLDGYQTLAAVRDLPTLADIPFIFLTAATDKRDMRRGMASGADDYLTKPFTPDELLEAVATRLARQTELKCGIYKQTEKLRKNVDHLLASELAGPLDGILGLTRPLIRDAGVMSPEKVSASARQISETILRLNLLAKSLA